MKTKLASLAGILLATVFASLALAQQASDPAKLKVHGIFASNMAFGLGKVLEGDMESVQAHLPTLRFFSIDPNEQSEPQDDIPAEKISTQGWAVSSPATALECSAIGYAFGARLQNALQIPIDIIKSARGGASIEAIVSGHPSLPLQNFRTDDWDLPANGQDFTVSAVADYKTLRDEALARCELRQTEEAKRGIEVLERLKTLGQVKE